MPEQPNPQATAREQSKEQLRHYRTVVSAAVNALRASEISTSFASITLEELIDQQIELIEGETQGGTRLSKLARVEKIKLDLDSVIDGIKETSPDLFRTADTAEDVNTPSGGGT